MLVAIARRTRTLQPHAVATSSPLVLKRFSTTSDAILDYVKSILPESVRSDFCPICPQVVHPLGLTCVHLYLSEL